MNGFYPEFNTVDIRLDMNGPMGQFVKYNREIIRSLGNWKTCISNKLLSVNDDHSPIWVQSVTYSAPALNPPYIGFISINYFHDPTIIFKLLIWSFFRVWSFEFVSFDDIWHKKLTITLCRFCDTLHIDRRWDFFCSKTISSTVQANASIMDMCDHIVCQLWIYPYLYMHPNQVYVEEEFSKKNSSCEFAETNTINLKSFLP